MQAIAAETAVPPPDPDGPSMYRFAAPGSVGARFESAGLVDVTEWDVDLELVTDSPAQYWQLISEHVSLVSAALRRVDEPARERMQANVVSAVGAYERDGAIRVPGVARCIVGSKPEA